MVDVILETVEVVLDDADELLVVGPLEGTSEAVVLAGVDALVDVVLGDADEREELVDVREPEDARDDGVVELEALR